MIKEREIVEFCLVNFKIMEHIKYQYLQTSENIVELYGYFRSVLYFWSPIGYLSLLLSDIQFYLEFPLVPF